MACSCHDQSLALLFSFMKTHEHAWSPKASKYEQSLQWPQQRPGHVVLFALPNQDPKGGVELGLILTVWKGVKAPKQQSGECSINSCVAFRAVCLDPCEPHQERCLVL